VAASALAVLTSSFDEALEHKKNRLKDIFELRKILEPQIAALAAKRIKQKTVSILSEIIAKQENAFNSGQESRMFDELFHQTLVEATGNNVLIHVYERLKGILSESRAGNLQSQERQERSLSIHKDILEAIAAGDSNLAARKMKQHMLDVQKTLSLLDKPLHTMKNSSETTIKQKIRK
jgi:GntR family transcriptional repressor for pyruvate dehydrogenase complex